jgi:proteasome lid subunit RPN8/RPN11
MRIIRRAMLLVMALVAGHSFAGELTSNPDVLDIFREVLREGFFSLQDWERAAFVIREDDGHYRSMMWPSIGLFRAARYPGPIPRGVVAIVHTHPLSLPLPSANDRALAMRLQMPIYCLTVSSIYKADGRGNTITVAKNRMWSNRSVVKHQTARQDPQTDLLEVCSGRLIIGGSDADRPCQW